VTSKSLNEYRSSERLDGHARFGRLLFASTRGVAAVAQTTITRFSIVGLNVFTGIITARVLGATAGRDIGDAALAGTSRIAVDVRHSDRDSQLGSRDPVANANS